MPGIRIGSDSVATALVVSLLFLAPLPAGSVTPAGQLVFRLAAFAILVLTVLSSGSRLREQPLLPGAAFAAVAALGLLQSAAWPPLVARLLSPRHVELYDQAALLTDTVPRVFLSLNPASSRASALAWAAAVALLVAAQSLGTAARRRRLFTLAILAAALVQGGVSVVQAHRSGQLLGTLLRPAGRFHGTFANPNHLALLCEIGMALALAWIWWGAGLRQGSRTRRIARWLPAALVWLVLLALVVLTGSRSGIAAAAAGTLAQIVALLLAGRGRQVVAVGLMILLGLGLLSAVVVGVEIERYRSVSLFEDNIRGRLEVVAASVELWLGFPVIGTGLGTFEDAFTLVAPAHLSRTLWNRAHNNWLELMVTGGVVGFSLAAIAVIVLLARIWRVWQGGCRLDERAAALAALGALAAAGLHELLDFGLVIPANAMALIVVLGTAAAIPVNRAPPAEE